MVQDTDIPAKKKGFSKSYHECRKNQIDICRLKNTKATSAMKTTMNTRAHVKVLSHMHMHVYVKALTHMDMHVHVKALTHMHTHAHGEVLCVTISRKRPH